MVIKGASKGHARDLARHLMRTDQNDRVEILEMDQTAAAQSLESLLVEYQTLAEHMTNADYGLYEASINPKDHEHLTREQWGQSVEILETALGMNGQPRVVVLHEKEGREHIHVVWQRTDVDAGKVIDDGHNYRKHEEAAREIEQKFDLERTPGVHVREPDEPRPVAEFDRADNQKAQRSGLDPAERAAQIRAIYDEARTGAEFISGLEENSYHLARGDTSNIYMLVDPQLDAHRLSSTLKGVRMKEIKEKLAPLTPEKLATVEEVRQALEQPEQALKEAQQLQDDYAQKSEEITAQQYQDRSRLEASHRLDNEAIQQGRVEEAPTGINKFLQNVTGISWIKEKLHNHDDRQRLAQQRQELEALKRDQLNQRHELERERKTELHELDKDTRGEPGHRARFEVPREEQKFNLVQERLQALTEYDQGRTNVQDINDQLQRFIQHKEKVEYRQNYLETLEQSVRNDFDAIYLDGADALQGFQQQASDESIKKAAKALENHPKDFGEINPETDSKSIKQHTQSAVTDARKVHYLKTRIENELQGLPMIETQIRQLQEDKLMLQKSFSDERLALMRELQQSASSLKPEQWDQLDPKGKHEITQARDVLKDRDKRQIADNHIKENRDAERQRELDRQSREREREKKIDNPDEPNY